MLLLSAKLAFATMPDDPAPCLRGEVPPNAQPWTVTTRPRRAKIRQDGQRIKADRAVVRLDPLGETLDGALVTLTPETRLDPGTYELRCHRGWSTFTVSDQPGRDRPDYDRPDHNAVVAATADEDPTVYGFLVKIGYGPISLPEYAWFTLALERPTEEYALLRLDVEAWPPGRPGRAARDVFAVEPVPRPDSHKALLLDWRFLDASHWLVWSIEPPPLFHPFVAEFAWCSERSPCSPPFDPREGFCVRARWVDAAGNAGEWSDPLCDGALPSGPGPPRIVRPPAPGAAE